MALQDYVSERRLAQFKSKLDENGYKNVIEKVKLNGTSQRVDPTDKSVNLFLPTWDFDHGAMSYAKTVALLLRTEDGQDTRKGMALSIDNAADPQKVMVGVWGNLDTEMYHAEVPTIAAMDEAIAIAIAAAQSGSLVKVDSYDALPEEGAPGKIYLVPNNGSGQNVYDEYVWCVIAMLPGGNGEESPVYGYEKIGTTAIDLTGYLKEEDMVEVTEAQIDAMFT